MGLGVTCCYFCQFLSVRHKSAKNGLIRQLDPAPSNAAATQSDDGVGTADSPEHAGSLQARSNDGLTAGFNYAGANEESLFTKLWIAHPAGIGGEVFSLF